jgi:hypothetical protein
VSARLILLVAALAALAACGERSQELGARQVKSDKPAFQGGDAPFTAPGWSAGERASWEQQLRARAQGQNEYARSPAAAPQ